MKLFTKSIDKKLFAQYPKGGNLEGQKVIAKVFNPYGRGRWYIMNSDPEDPDYLWGIVELFEGEPEVGSISRTELENIKVGAFKLPLERDLYFDEVNAMELYRGLKNGKRYEKGGKTDNVRTIGFDDAVLYRDEIYYLVKRKDEVGLVSYEQGAWGSKGKFIPLKNLSVYDVEENITDPRGNKVNIPPYEELMKRPYGFMAKGGNVGKAPFYAEKMRNGHYKLVGKIPYDLYDELGRNNLSEEQLEYSKSSRSESDYDRLKSIANDVSGSQYDYNTNDAIFTASTLKDVQNWEKQHNSKVYVKYTDGFMEDGGRLEDAGYLVQMAEEYAEREYEKPVKKGEGIAKANRTEDGKLKYTEVIVLFKDGESKLFEEEDFEEFFDVDEYAKGGTIKLLDQYDIDKGNYFYRRYEGAVGSFAWRNDDNKYNEGILFPLDDFDKDFYSHIQLKDGEALFRYKTEIMGDNLFPLIKVNFDRLVVHFLDDSTDEKNPKFYRSGTPLIYITLERYYYEVREFAKGGKILTTKQRYVSELNSVSGVSKNAIEDFINENDLSDDEILNIIVGIGRKQINAKDFATALVGNKNNSEYKKLMAFIKSNKALTPKLNYTPKYKITSATIKYEGKEYLVSGDDLITGAYKLAEGGLSDKYVYIPKRDVIKITTKDGDSLTSNVNGVWVKKEYFASAKSKSSGKYEPSQATKVFAYKLTELAKDKEMTLSFKDSMVESLSMVDDFVSDLKYEIENNISGLAITTYAKAVKFVSKKSKPRVAKNLAFYENSDVIKLFPEEFTKTTILSKKAISMKGNLLENTAFLNELSKFTSEDALRPAMTSIHFDGKDVVATDAHILVHLRNEVEVEKQSICTTKVCNVSKGADQRYPAWRDIIARNLDDSKYKNHTFDLDKLIVLTNWINNYYSVWENYVRVVSITTKNGQISFNPEKLLKALTMLKVMGVKKPIMYYESPNRAVYFGEDGKLSGDPMTDNFVLLMPLSSASAEAFSLDVTTDKYKIAVPNFEYAKGGELEMGIETEMKEHGMSEAEATKTAKDHLREHPNYYTKMKKAGLEDGGELTLFAKGGATFDDKVRAIKRNLVGKNVPKDYQGEYGKKYDKDEAEESARRIAGAMRKNYKK